MKNLKGLIPVGLVVLLMLVTSRVEAKDYRFCMCTEGDSIKKSVASAVLIVTFDGIDLGKGAAKGIAKSYAFRELNEGAKKINVNSQEEENGYHQIVPKIKNYGSCQIIPETKFYSIRNEAVDGHLVANVASLNLQGIVFESIPAAIDAWVADIKDFKHQPIYSLAKPIDEMKRFGKKAEKYTLRPLADEVKAIDKYSLQPIADAGHKVEKYTIRPVASEVRRTQDKIDNAYKKGRKKLRQVTGIKW
ncbi:MAG: hypothetical protein AAF620_08565 [Bacteroidota bacterium]